MSAASPGIAPVKAGIVAGSLRCAAAAIGVVAVTAVVVVLAGVADDARRALGFGFAGGDRSLAEAGRIAIHNARFAAGTLICAALAPTLTSRGRAPIDLLLAALLVLNAVTVGVAIGAYGSRVIEATALHLALELAALSLAGGAYMQARTQPLCARTLALIAAICAAALTLAATLETYVQLGALR